MMQLQQVSHIYTCVYVYIYLYIYIRIYMWLVELPKYIIECISVFRHAGRQKISGKIMTFGASVFAGTFNDSQ